MMNIPIPLKLPDYIPMDSAGLRLDTALARLFSEHSRSRLQTWLKEGRITLNGEVVTDVRRIVKGGECAVIPSMRQLTEQIEHAEQSENIALPIVFEDESLIVIDKPVGLVVHPGNGNRSGTMMNALLHHAPQLAGVPRAGIVHRLDKDTSGLLVVAKTLEAQTDLVRQLQARTVKRHYLALVHGRLIKNGCVDAPIGRHPVHRIRMAVVSLSKGGREARTHYSVREVFAAITLLECRLETGRTHQIRVHLTSLGHPLVGDATYGRQQHVFSRQALHACQLALLHPVTREEMTWTAPLPEDMAVLLESLRHG
ncbi:MAG: RluA family pseudouridine synthase [Rhodocyclaceae bacterium]|nr:RluA family pseudouridine synthase [Rhodocyclaceae bacterium]